MRVLVAMVSTGRREHLSDLSFPRAAKWASRNDYTAILIKGELVPPDRPPHYGKLRVPDEYPGFDQYCIVDDDLLISSAAPPLPIIPHDKIALVPDAIQEFTTRAGVDWTGNTGFILCPSGAVPMLREAVTNGDAPDVWPGFADQSALNAVLWRTRSIFELDKRWNFAPVLEFLHSGRGWDRWRRSRLYRASYYAGIATELRWRSRALLRQCWGCHLIHARSPELFDRLVP